MSATNPELGLNGNGTITYTYDDSGNLATRSDPRVTTTFSTYDGMNRVTGKSYNDGITPAVGYAYYPPCFGGCATLSQGRLMSVTSGALVNEYLDYDTMGRVTKSRQITAGVTYPFAYHYDQSGALASVKYPSGRVVTNTFDVAGRILQVSGPSNKNYASQVLYAPQGAIQSLTLFNGVAETWGFNTRQQPISLQALGSQASLNLTWTYGADSSNNGNVMTQAITRGSTTFNQTYQYVDPSNRLSFGYEPGGWQQTYNYDAFGNRAMPGSYVPNPDQTPAALTEFTVNRWKRGNGDTYDGSGNQTAVATRANPGTSVNFFTYDGENRMVTSNVASMGVVTYSYDGEGRRVQKSWSCSVGNGTCTTVFVYDAMGQLAAEYSTAPNTASGTEYLTADSLGSTRLVTDASGNVTQCYDYLPFGEEIPQGINGRGSCYPPSAVYPHVADATSRKFTGKERDVETGLDYFGARYFSAAQGRFTSPDWSETPQAVPYADLSNPQTLNLYSYVRNNPLSKADPDGHCGLIGDDPCSLSQFVASLPDRLTGGLKGEANWVLDRLPFTQSVPRFTASNPEQAETMQGVKDAEPVLDVTVAVVLPGPKGEAGVAPREAPTGTTLQPGPFAGESIPARGPQRNFTSAERAQINQIGETTGCHTCGTTNPGTKSGNFVPDHQPANALNPSGGAQGLYPHCVNCSNTQGGQVRQVQRKLNGSPKPKRKRPNEN